MKAADLREKSAEDLHELQKTVQHDVFQNRLKNFTNRLDDTSSIPKNKRDLARILTVLREQAMGIQRAPKAHDEPATPKEPKAAKEKKAAAPKKAKAAAAETKPKKTAAKKTTAKKSEAK
jgi:large subunit ribosomal protein L29